MPDPIALRTEHDEPEHKKAANCQFHRMKTSSSQKPAIIRPSSKPRPTTKTVASNSTRRITLLAHRRHHAQCGDLCIGRCIKGNTGRVEFVVP